MSFFLNFAKPCIFAPTSFVWSGTFIVHTHLTSVLVDCPTQLICTWIFICWFGLAHFENSRFGLAHFGNSQFGLAHFRNSQYGLAHFRNSWFGLAHFGNSRFGAGPFKKTFEKMSFFGMFSTPMSNFLASNSYSIRWHGYSAKRIGPKRSFLREIGAQTFYYPLYAVATACCVPWQS